LYPSNGKIVAHLPLLSRGLIDGVISPITCPAPTVPRRTGSPSRGPQATFFGRYEIQATFIFGKSNLSRLPTAPNPLLELIKTCAIQKNIAGVAMPVATRLVLRQKS
jgi:hypothetical protein